MPGSQESEFTLVVRIKDVSLSLSMPPDPDELLEALDQEAFARDERMPYWAELWPASLALADEIHEFAAARDRSLKGIRVLELGCGLGVPGMVAASLGAQVLATDYESSALEYVALNAQKLGFDVETSYLDWREPEPLHGFDLVMGADLLYERQRFDPLRRLLYRDLGRPRPEIWLADPKRSVAKDFVASLKALPLPMETKTRQIDYRDRTRLIDIHRVAPS